MCLYFHMPSNVFCLLWSFDSLLHTLYALLVASDIADNRARIAQDTANETEI